MGITIKKSEKELISQTNLESFKKSLKKSGINLENFSKHIKSYYSGDLIIHYTRKSKSSEKTLENFISRKNKIIFKSHFDHSGAKQFLAEKKKALEELNLIDEIPKERERERKNIHYICNNKKDSKSIKKHKINKVPKKYSSHNAVTLLKNIEKIKDNKIHENNKFEYYLKNNKNIEKNQIKNHRKKCSIESIHSKIPNINGNESSYLMTGDDSFLFTIIEQMTNFKN